MDFTSVRLSSRPIRRNGSADTQLYRDLANLHSSALAGGFLASLGPKVLAELYRAIGTTRACKLIVEMQNDEVVGFIAGGSGMGPIYRQMLRRPLHLAVAVAPVFLNPRKIRGIWEILKHGQDRALQVDLPQYELLSIAVVPVVRGTGVAARLYTRLIDHCQSNGIVSFRITVGDGLTPAHRFYSKVGAKPIARTEVHKGQGSTVYLQYI